MLNYKFLQYFIFPRRCAVCNKVIDIRKEYCDLCKLTLQRVPHYVALLWSYGNTNYKTFRDKPRFSGYVSPFLHSSGSRSLVYSYKFKNRTELSEIISNEMADTFNKYYSNIEFDYVVAVPMKLLAKLKRGYDQVDILSRKLSKKISIPYIKALKQHKRKRPQHKVGQVVKRFQNVKGIYAMKNNIDISGKTVLLVDDIITTGATVNECSKVLLKAGAKEVYCISATING